MVFSSAVFLFAFLPICLAGYYLLQKREAKNVFLLIMSLAFYAWGEPKYILLLLFSILLNYICALLIDKNRDSLRKMKLFLVCGLIADLGILFVFKYLGFFMTNVRTFTGADIAVPDIALPIGISFFTFQAISYLADVYTNKAKLQKSLYKLALYISFFPQLIAGPIVRYNSIEEQMDSRKEDAGLFSGGVRRFIIGLAKKSILANLLAVFTDSIFEYGYHERTVLLAWFGVLGYCLQLYYDFSGYSDMAIGLGRMFGFKFEENFDYPYISRSASEFWRRWHISLGRWFKDYVYIPLGGSKKGMTRHIMNLFVVWLLTGIWHGASWNFVLFGLYYFIIIAAEHFIRGVVPETVAGNKGIIFLQHIYALIVVYFGWLLFRVSGLQTLSRYLKDMFGFSGNSLYDSYSYSLVLQYLPVVIIGVVFATPVLKVLQNRMTGLSIMKPAADIAGVLLFIVSLSFVVSSAYNPFIYFNF